MSERIGPRPLPCASCPYRLDVPSGVWDAAEYDKLPDYDGSTGEQAMAGAFGVFMCHSTPGMVCAGWAGCHDMEENLALRLAAAVDPAVDIEAVRAYECPVPLFASGAEAAGHGKRDIEEPSSRARAKVLDIVKVRARQGRPVRWRGKELT